MSNQLNRPAPRVNPTPPPPLDDDGPEPEHLRFPEGPTPFDDYCQALAFARKNGVWPESYADDDDPPRLPLHHGFDPRTELEG